MRKLFAQPGFSRLFSGLSTSMLGDSIMLLVLSMWVKTLTGSNALAGFTFFFMVLPALGAPLLGVWVDRLPRKPIVVWGNLAGDRVLRNVLVGLGASIFVIGFFESSIYALLDAFDRSPTFAGVLVTVQGVGAVAGGLTASLVVRRLGEVAAVAVGLATMALGT